MFSNSRIGSNSTNKQEDDDEEDEAPLEPGQLLPFLQAHRREKDGEYCQILSSSSGISLVSNAST